METARGFAELLKSGWKPKRTIILAAWDGEEWGLLGSTEWAEKHKDELATKGVVYINSDSTGKGWIGMSGSHSLQAFINEIARDVPDPRGSGKSALEAKRARLVEQARTDKEKADLGAKADLPIDALGSGSDYTAFIDHLNIASLDLGFGGDGGGGIYHSIYDTFYWYTHFSDGDFTHSAALSKTVGTALMRLADAEVLPFEFKGTATTLSQYVDEIEKMPSKGGKVDVAPLRAAIAKLSASADAYEKAIAKMPKGATTAAADLAALNRVLYRTERAFRYEKGLPKREWFKHLAYAPGFYTGYGVKTLPGIREGIEQNQIEEARSFVPIVAAAITKLAGEVDKAAGMVRKIGS